MKKSLLKIICLAIIAGLNWAGLSAVLETRAYFNDTETSSENTFSAGTLDFSLSNSGDFSPPVTPSNPTSTKNISIQNEGSLSLKYQIKFDNVSGDLCNYVTLKAELEGVEKYNGSIIKDQNLLSEPLPVLNKDEKDNLIFTATFTGSDPGLQNQTCTFDFVFDGSQIGGSGFSDQEEITSVLQSGGWVISPGEVVINEVEYDTRQPGTDADYEWFELYNNTSLAVTLLGWTITDNNAIDTIPELTIAPQGFAVVAASPSFLLNYPGFSGNIVYIPDESIGNGLSNTGDRLVLKRADGVEIDAVSWLGDDYAFGEGNGVTPATGAGHSIARKIKGLDTDSPDDWQKLITPNPGTNPHYN